MEGMRKRRAQASVTCTGAYHCSPTLPDLLTVCCPLGYSLPLPSSSFCNMHNCLVLYFIIFQEYIREISKANDQSLETVGPCPQVLTSQKVSLAHPQLPD